MGGRFAREIELREEDLFEAIRAGASGYLLKDIPLDEVAEAVRALIK